MQMKDCIRQRVDVGKTCEHKVDAFVDTDQMDTDCEIWDRCIDYKKASTQIAATITTKLLC